MDRDMILCQGLPHEHAGDKYEHIRNYFGLIDEDDNSKDERTAKGKGMVLELYKSTIGYSLKLSTKNNLTEEDKVTIKSIVNATNDNNRRTEIS